MLRAKIPSGLLSRALLAALATACLLPAAAHAGPAEPEGRMAKRLWLTPLLASAAASGPANQYEAIPVQSAPTGIPAAQHGDLNLALRGYGSSPTAPGFTSVGGPVDPGAPQMPGIFGDNRTPKFTSAHRVNDWNWACGGNGCRGNPITSPSVTLLGMGTRAGEALSLPSRNAEIYPGGYTALVLYADEKRITLKYTRDDNVVDGYTAHLEGLNVDPNLLALYRQMDAAGRGNLPALRNHQALGAASGSEVLVAIRDCGTFMDPQSRKDWWQGR